MARSNFVGADLGFGSHTVQVLNRQLAIDTRKYPTRWFFNWFRSDLSGWPDEIALDISVLSSHLQYKTISTFFARKYEKPKWDE